MQEQPKSNTTKKKWPQLTSVVERGSASPLQFDKCLTYNEIDAPVSYTHLTLPTILRV